MNAVFFVLIDFVALLAIASLYYRRHHRRDLVVVLVALNVGVLAVANALASLPVGVGLGLGLFGLLSVVRLRADAIAHQDVGYLFISLALGVYAGLGSDHWWAVLAVAVGFVSVLYLADHPGFMPHSRRLVITLDAAIVDQAALRTRLERELGGPIRQMRVSEIDLVRDLTVVDVRFVERSRSPVRQSPEGYWVTRPPHPGNNGRTPAGTDRWR